MGMDLKRAFRLPNAPVVAFTGAGGKTGAIFELAKGYPQAIVTATTHLGEWQVKLADHHMIVENLSEMNGISPHGSTLITGPIQDGRTTPINDETLHWLYDIAKKNELPLFIEADGSRQKPLKAPADHEPPVPAFCDSVIVTAGLSGLGLPLLEENVHRAGRFAALAEIELGQPVTADALCRMLTHPFGGQKNIPTDARRMVFLNQADNASLQSIGGKMAESLLKVFDAVIVGSRRTKTFQAFEHKAGIILAAGQSTRFGSTKQLLNWKGKPFVCQVAETALQAGLRPLVVVTGHDAVRVEAALRGLPVIIAHNPDYLKGQSSSIRAGLQALPANIMAAIFLLADQPQVSQAVIRALAVSHTSSMPAILAPLVLEEKRANPVLFDRDTFADLMQLEGDVGGRAIFHKYKVEFLPWHDESLLLDVDNPQDYEQLKGQA